MSSSFPVAPFTAFRYPYFFFPPFLLPPVPPAYAPSTVTGQFNINSLLQSPAADELRSPLKPLVTMKCPHCSQTFDSAPVFDLHLLSHQPKLQLAMTTSIVTSFSAQASSTKTSLTPVSSSKSPSNCQCTVCGKIFSRHWLLQGHIRTHTGEKPFKCHICSKAFADKSNLRAHIQTHSGVKPFACNRCGKKFALKSYLSKHEESTCLRTVSKSRQVVL